jgi:transcriptional regulator with XRE-family HTH domain
MQHIVDQIIEESGLSKGSLSARSGMARSTLWRIRDGLVDPTVGSVRELALSAGYELELSLAPLSDPDAGRAARVILDALFEASFELAQPHQNTVAWIERLHRWVPSGDPVEVCRTAGQSSSLLHRKGAIFLRGRVTELKLASAGEFSKRDWFLSGAAVIKRIGKQDSTMSDDAMPYVVHTDDPRRLDRLLDNMEHARPEKATLIIAERTDGIGIDAWTDGKIQLVAPIQGLIDAFGIGGNLAIAAERIARSW